LESQLLISSSPHIRDEDTTDKIMKDVVIALIPALIAGIYYFGFRVLLVAVVTILACVVSEYLSRRIMKRNQTIQDFSAVVTGMLLALSLPPTIPLWIAVVGGTFAIVIVKQLFGGLGQNFMNPALAARIVLLVSWPQQMTTWINPNPDVISSATPLALIKEGVSKAELPCYLDLFIGNIAGTIGETCVPALLLGAAYLLIRRVITLEIPLTFVGTTVLLTWIFGGETLFTGDILYHLLSGGLIMAAFFMATDYTTSPVTFKGRIIMGIGCGILTAVIRLFGSYPDGVSFAIIIMNVIVPLIDRYTIPVSFGGEKSAA